MVVPFNTNLNNTLKNMQSIYKLKGSGTFLRPLILLHLVSNLLLVLKYNTKKSRGSRKV